MMEEFGVMDIFSIFTLCGGLAFFLYGMIVMSAGLEKIAGGKMEKLLEKMTSNPVKSFALELRTNSRAEQVYHRNVRL